MDPMAEKYYSISPYVYVANNPMKFIDPTGMVIKISSDNDDGSIEEEINYDPGMEYKGENSFINDAVRLLNKMNSVNNGKIVLDKLHGTDNTYGINNLGTATAGGFRRNEYGIGGNVRLQIRDLETTSHEMFHAYQYEVGGETGLTEEEELEAALFSGLIAYQYSYIDNLSLKNEDIMKSSGIPNGTPNGETYAKAFQELFYAKEFNQQSFNTAVQYFKSGSAQNSGCIYIII